MWGPKSSFSPNCSLCETECWVPIATSEDTKFVGMTRLERGRWPRGTTLGETKTPVCVATVAQHISSVPWFSVLH